MPFCICTGKQSGLQVADDPNASAHKNSKPAPKFGKSKLTTDDVIRDALKGFKLKEEAAELRKEAVVLKQEAVVLKEEAVVLKEEAQLHFQNAAESRQRRKVLQAEISELNQAMLEIDALIAAAPDNQAVAKKTSDAASASSAFKGKTRK